MERNGRINCSSGNFKQASILLPSPKSSKVGKTNCRCHFNLLISFSKQKEMREFLNDFEEIVLSLVASLQDNAYGAAINVEIEKWLQRKVALSFLHVTLYKLEDRGYV